MTVRYGSQPVDLGLFNFDLSEVMYYLYLPVAMQDEGSMRVDDIRMPRNVEPCRTLVMQAIMHTALKFKKPYRYAYLSARKGWATPDNPLNRPGWHCDGFGTDDLNFVWWKGPGTRFLADGPDEEYGYAIVSDHLTSLRQFEDIALAMPERIYTPSQSRLYMIDPGVIHATPEIQEGCWRQYVKISLSNHRYNLENNSHNHLFDYDWPMFGREEVRNDPHNAQKDYA